MMKQHELSAIFPALPDGELQALAADIKANGLHSSIVVHQGKVLDGWHRYQACGIAKVHPRTIEYRGKDPAAYVKSMNWQRRHLTASQKSMAEVALSEWLDHGDVRRRTSSAKTSQEMADEAQVSKRSIDAAKVVHTQGSEALKDAVMQGDVGVEKAAAIAKTLPKRQQVAAIKSPNPAARKQEDSGPALSPKEVERLALENEALRNDLTETKDALAELTGIASAADAVKNGEEFKKIVALEAELKSVKRRRDELMNENAELKRMLSLWRNRAEKAERKKAA